MKTQSIHFERTIKSPTMLALRKRLHRAAVAKAHKPSAAPAPRSQPAQPPRRLPLPSIGLTVWEG